MKQKQLAAMKKQQARKVAEPLYQYLFQAKLNQLKEDIKNGRKQESGFGE
jgi:hypothetical protein